MNQPGFPRLDRTFYLPRLDRIFYQGDAVAHWEMNIVRRARGWLTTEFHLRFREVMVHTCFREGFVCPVYCLMPDHIHLVWMGLRIDSDQLNGMAFLRTHLEPALKGLKFQHQAYDHVLRDEERRRDAFAHTCRYILENPIRAKLVEAGDRWEFGGALVPGFPRLHPLDKNFWPRFWRVYQARKDPETAKMRRPLRFDDDAPAADAASSRRPQA